MKVETLNDIFLKTITLDRPFAMKSKKAGHWIELSVAELERTVRHVSTGLRELGIKSGDRVAILSENRPEWTLSDMAILARGAVTVPIYATLLGWQIEFILRDAGTAAVVVSNEEQLAKILQIRSSCPGLTHVIICDPPASLPEGILTFEEVADRGRELEAREGTRPFEERLREATADDLATIVYTSGTTGNPKGAMLTHGNIASNVVATAALLPTQPGDVSLSILPLSHILQRMGDFSFLYLGVSIAYNDDLANVPENLQTIRPHLFAAVPRLFEKMQARILDTVATAPPIRQKLFAWALDVGRQRLPYRVEHKPVPFPLSLKAAIADKLVFSKIKARMGGRVRLILSGGAPLSAELAAFFIGAGLEIYEGYGLTETSPVIAINTPHKRRLGTVGPIIEGVQVRIAPDGEILTRGPHVMKGYYNNPEATAKAIDSEGWFHTGDIGEIDSDGFLKITDRKKDIIVTAYGKNIAPQPLEELLKTSPYIATPVLIGDKRKYIAALIIPNFEKLERDARRMGIAFDSREELVADPRIRDLIQKEIDRFNESLDRQERIRRFAILPEEFTIESGEITPSMKVKRKTVGEKFKHLIDEMYEDETLVDTR